MTPSADWWMRLTTPSVPSSMVVTLPAAGAPAESFAPWRGRLPGGTVLMSASLPGRGIRRDEITVTSAEQAAEQLADGLGELLHLPWVLVGHSAGSILAVALLEALRRLEEPLPDLLVVCGAEAPRQCSPSEWLHTASDEALASELARLGGTPPGLLEEGVSRQALIRAFRADLRWAERFNTPAEPFDVPIRCVTAGGDTEVTSEGVSSWASLTTAGMQRVIIPGGHFSYMRMPEHVLGLTPDE